MNNFQRLLYSDNGSDPYIFLHKTLSRGKILIQKRQIVLGTRYGFVIVKNDTDGSDNCCLYGHQFDVSRDKNKDFHVFRYTTIATAELMRLSALHHATMEQCNTVDLIKCSLVDKRLGKIGHTYSQKLSFFQDDVSAESVVASQGGSSLFSAQDIRGNLLPEASSADPGSILRVATYNIWNLNGLADVESYEDRLQRLRKV